MKIEWTSVDSKLPLEGQSVLMKVYNKSKRYIITQGHLSDDAKRLSFHERSSEEHWRGLGYGLTWYDYAGRQIQSLSAESKNRVSHWAPLPK